MVKEQKLGLMETCMKENLRMGKEMVKGHTLGLMEENMLGNSRMGKQNGHGTVTSPDGKYVGECNQQLLKQLLKQLLNECDVKKSYFMVEVFESHC